MLAATALILVAGCKEAAAPVTEAATTTTATTTGGATKDWLAVTAATPVVAVEMPNEAGSGNDWRRYVVSVDALEARTGYDFLRLVSTAAQGRIEAREYAGE